jgi:hypothetical protein
VVVLIGMVVIVVIGVESLRIEVLVGAVVIGEIIMMM